MADEAEGEEYEIVSKKEVEELKEEVEKLKKGSGSKGVAVDLAKSINELNELIKEAVAGVKAEEAEEESAFKKIGSLADNISSLADQNEKIAEGIVALADMIKELKEDLENIKKPSEAEPAFQPRATAPPPIRPSFAYPPFGNAPAPMPQTMQMPPPPPDLGPLPDLEPLPDFGPWPGEEEPKKKGLFGRLRK